MRDSEVERNRAGLLIACVGLAIGWAIGCDDATLTRAPSPAGASASAPSPASASAPAASPASAPVPVPVPGDHRGVRVDLRDQGHHVRALLKQPDGTYRSVCIDAPGALRPATPRAGGHANGRP